MANKVGIDTDINNPSKENPSGAPENTFPKKGKLYLCPTPIGNLGDITKRTLEVLENADLIAAEDTRVTLKLLNSYGIKKTLTSYYEHNKREKGRFLLKKLLAGENIALVTDAGMPGISDPGEDIVKQCRENRIEIEALPGPCAFVTALVASGMPAGRFTFEGFLSTNKKSRTEHLESLKGEMRTMIFYEAPHKLPYTLRDMANTFGGDRDVVIAREITKKHEEYLKMTLSEAIEHFENTAPKGEFVLIVAGDKEKPRQESGPDAETLIRACISEGIKGKSAAKIVSETLKIPKNQAYALYLAISGD